MTEILLKVALNTIKQQQQKQTNKTKQTNNKINEQELQLYHQFNY